MLVTESQPTLRIVLPEFTQLHPDVAESALQRPVDLETYLDWCGLLGHGFGYGELVRSYGHRHNRPPRSMWQDFATVLAMANAFRERAIDEAGVKGLTVAAAYRPTGGATHSAHKKARALDLDRIGGDGAEYFRCAVRFWCEHGLQHRSGLGLYTWASFVKSGIRVHLDVNHGCRSWQGIRSSFGRPYKIKDADGRTHQLGLVPYLAQQMGLDVPSLSYM